MQYSNIFYVRQPVYGQEMFYYIIVMKDIMTEKRQEFVRRQFKKAKKQELKEILEAL